MAEVIRRNAALVLGVILTGVIFAFAAPAMRFHTGAPGPSLLHAESPMFALAAVLGALLLAVVVACAVGRIVNAAVGLFVLGAGIFVLANRGGTLEHLLFGDGALWLLIVESLVWAGFVLAATVVVFKASGPLRDIEPDISGRRPHWLLSKEAAISAGAGVAVLPVVWFIAQSPMKGQTLAAVILGGVAAGLAGRLLSPHVQPKLLFASVCVFAAVGHAAGMFMMQSDLEARLVAGALVPVSLPMPMDYAAGSLLGVSMGLGWAKSFLHHED